MSEPMIIQRDSQSASHYVRAHSRIIAHDLLVALCGCFDTTTERCAAGDTQSRSGWTATCGRCVGLAKKHPIYLLMTDPKVPA